MKPIMPHLWFDTQAKEAAEFYSSIIPNSGVTNVTTIHNTPSGDSDIVQFKLDGQKFMAISAGPLFKFNPSISFHLKFKTVEEVDTAWNKLVEAGSVLMPLGSYPFNERFGWLQDKYGLSWQIQTSSGQEFTQRIIPALTFVGDVCGKVEEALDFYTSTFPNGSSQILMRYGAGEEPEKEGNVKFAKFSLNGFDLAAMESAGPHNFKFNEAISFVVQCESQEEIDMYWNALSAVPESEQCGWLKDKYGVSWQIVPVQLGEWMTSGTDEQRERMTQAFLKMKKFDLATLQQAYEG